MAPFLRKQPGSDLSPYNFDGPDSFKHWMRWACFATFIFFVVGLLLCFCLEGCGCSSEPKGKEQKVEKNEQAGEKRVEETVDLTKPVRDAPKYFPPNSNMPKGKETLHSGPIDLKTFDPKRDLIRFEDSRVWFESDHDGDTDDGEDDHLIHRNMEIPLKRLVNLVTAKKGKLKIQDTYRPAKANDIHMANSLHCEGRAIDLTSEGISLTELAKLCWQSGFDFVLYEVPKRSGVHLHCSVKRTPDPVRK